MIAQVWTAKVPAGPIPDERRKWAEDALSEAKTHDGVEGSISVSDPASGESLTIVLFRDQAALDAYQAFSNEKIAEAGELGGETGAGRLYSEVIAAL
jgi:hypothetical protein